MKTIKQTYEISAPIERVWQALTNPAEIEAWGGGPAKMDSVEGGLFSLWGGEIFGKNTEVAPSKKLSQEWYITKSPQPTKVTFILREKDDKTIIDLVHDDVPDEAVSEIANSWQKDYLGKVKKYLEE